MPRNQRAKAVVAVVATALVSLIVPSGAAHANGVLTFDAPVSEYGAQWTLTATDPSVPVGWDNRWTPTVAMRGGPAGYTPEGYMGFTSYQGSGVRAEIYPRYDARPLAPGTYEIDFTASNAQWGAYGTATPVKLVIEPATLAMETRALADASDPSSAIISVRFTGAFVDSFTTTSLPNAPLTPSGSWVVSITDEDGEVFEKTIARGADSDILATSFLWADSEPGEQYAVTAKFAPSGASADYFDISAAGAFSYTAPTVMRTFAASSTPDTPVLAPREQAVFSVPLWWAVLAGVVLAALAALALVFSVKLARTTPADSPKAVTHA